MSELLIVGAIAIGTLAILQIVVILWLVFRSSKAGATPIGDSAVATLQRQIESLERSISSRMSETTQAMQRSLLESTEVVTRITAEITSVKEIGRETTKMAEQVKALQDILRNPKQRGVLGEYFLETVLKNVFPPHGSYKMQYSFRNGETVDAVVFIRDKIVPIDSKFSLENYNRFVEAPEAERATFERAFVNDLKQRIEETAKYIRPEENTLDFAFMFIPSEGIYYDLLTNRVGASQAENLIQQAAAKRVIIVSPTSFLAYLHTVIQGLRALTIEQKAMQIEASVAELGRHMSNYQEFYRKLGASLGITVGHYNNGAKELGKVDKDVLRISGEKVGSEIPLIDKPADPS